MSTLVLDVADGIVAAGPLLAVIGLALAVVPQSRRRNLAVGSIGVLILWYAVAYVATLRGAFEAEIAGVPTVVLGLVPAAAGIVLLWLVPAVQRLLVEPGRPANLIAVQSFRMVGVGFLLLWAVHRLPVLFAVPAGAGDFLTGAFAWGVANAVREGRTGRGVVWNLLGLLDLVVAMSLGVLSSPPLHLSPDGLTTGAVGFLPLALVPAFGVPVAMMLHLASLRSLRSIAAGARARKAAVAAAARVS
ncbi:MAG: hypothetical protein J2P22_18195 [Nocardioides sp.]|nr:hypothetical protein [Nocardioides sp.]